MLVGDTGFEPVTSCVSSRHSTTELIARMLLQNEQRTVLYQAATFSPPPVSQPCETARTCTAPDLPVSSLHPSIPLGTLPPARGRSSVVEHHLAKVGVEGSNPFVRSIEHSEVGPRAQHKGPRGRPSFISGVCDQAPHTATWPSGKAEACKAFIPGSNPGVASKRKTGRPLHGAARCCSHALPGDIQSAQECCDPRRHARAIGPLGRVNPRLRT